MGPKTNVDLHHENLAFAGTSGSSAANRAGRFVPAFRDDATGQIRISRFANGRPAPMHLLDGLPAEWAVAYDRDGRICAVKGSVTSGFLRDGRFYTREQAAEFTATLQ